MPPIPWDAPHYTTAVARDNLPALELLLDNNADVNLTDNDGNTPLDLWHVHKNKKMLVMLQAAGAKPFDLFQVAANNDRAAAERLLAAGVDAKAENDAGKTAFEIAVEAEHYALAAILLKAAVGINGRDKKSWRPLHWAIFADDWDLVRKFIAEGGNLNAGRNQNAFDVAQHMKSERELIAAFVDVKGVDGTVGEYDDTLLMLAIERGSIAIAKQLIELNADLSAKNMFGRTALTVAIQHRKNDIAKLLLKHKADVNIQDRQGRTAITWATFNKDIEMIKLLIEHDAKLDLRYNNGSTVLTWAASSGDSEMTEIFIEHGANVNVRKENGETPLILAAKKGDSDGGFKTLELLIAQGVNVNTQGRDTKETALMAAALHKQAKAVELLLQHGADPDLQNNYGGTAMTRAAQFGYTNIVQLLLDNGADHTLKNKQNETALDIAIDMGNEELVALLRARLASEREGENRADP